MRTKRGFTLVELFVVIIILSIIATIAIPKFADSNTKAKEARLKLFLNSAREATERYHADIGLWPQPVDLLNGVTPTQGYDDAGTLQNVPSGTYNGPYFARESFVVGIVGVNFAYGVGAPYAVGSWRLTGTATASDGTLYSSW